MAHFRKYEKIHRWDHEDEITGINVGNVHIQEKIDGANAQILQGNDGYLYVGSRTRNIARAKNEDKWPFEIMDNFRGLPEYLFQDKKIRRFFKDTKDKYILYGEWLVKHTVNYAPEFQNTFWIFDVYDREKHEFMLYYDYADLLVTGYDLDIIQDIDCVENPSMDQLLDMVRDESKIPKSSFGAETIEGLVFKNFAFKNKFGDQVWMKAVTKDFMEVHQAIMGGGNMEPEAYLIKRYQTPARMDKIYNKLVDEGKGVEVPLNVKHVPEFMQRVIYDLFTEEAWNMFMKDKKVRRCQFSMVTLRKISYAKSKNWFIGKLQERMKQ